MLASRILSFVDKYKSDESVTSQDILLLATLRAHFSRHLRTALLDKTKDVDVMINFFAKRFLAGSITDYSIYPTAINQDCVTIAKELAAYIDNKNYLTILFPNVSNTVDPHNLSKISDIENPSDVFLTNNGSFFYSKKAFAIHLQAQGFKLSIRRVLPGSTKIDALSVSELSNLKSSRTPEGVDGTYATTDERFVSFWDFVNKKTFSRLQTLGCINNHLLLHLLLLVEAYFNLKNNRVSFEHFQKEFKKFQMNFEGLKLENVNYFYGIPILDNENKYLIELLMEIYEAKDFTIDRQMIAIAKWLYRYNKELKSNVSNLASVYEVPPASSQTVDEQTSQSYSAEPMWSFLLSLFITKFTFFLPLSGYTIAAWDRTNLVTKDAEEAFRRIASTDNYSLLPNQYSAITQEVTKKYTSSPSFFAGPATNDPNINWLNMVYRGDYTAHNINWFEPEMFILAYYKYNSANNQLNEKIKFFLDELIHTYAQSVNPLQKMLRVNILFSDLLSGISEENKRNLVLLVKLYNVTEARKRFYNKSQYYLLSRMIEIGRIPADKEQLFIAHMNYSPSTNSNNSSSAPSAPIEVDLEKLLQHFTARLSLFKLPADDETMIRGYLSSLLLPILSQNEKSNLGKSVPDQRAFGAFC